MLLHFTTLIQTILNNETVSGQHNASKTGQIQNASSTTADNLLCY